MESDLIMGILVDTLEDIDLAIVGPRRADHPERRPSAADVGWDVRKVADDECAGVI